MRKTSLRRAACAAGALLLAAVSAPAAAEFEKGLLWSLAKDGEIVGYLFGTAHSNDPRVVALSQRVLHFIDSADSFTMEAFPGSRYFNPHWGYRSVARDMTLPEGETLAALLGEELYARIAPALAASGAPAEMIPRLRPWAAMSFLSMQRGGGDAPSRGRWPQAAKQALGPIQDHALFEYAGERTSELYQVETLEELMAAYYDFPLDAQVALLRDRAATRGEAHRFSREVIDAYLAGDLARMLDWSTRFISADSRKRGFDRVYLKHVLHIRNIVMAHYMLAPLRRKRTFIAIGALHLWGEQGVPAIMRDTYGFELRPVALDAKSAWAK